MQTCRASGFRIARSVLFGNGVNQIQRTSRRRVRVKTDGEAVLLKEREQERYRLGCSRTRAPPVTECTRPMKNKARLEMLEGIFRRTAGPGRLFGHSPLPTAAGIIYLTIDKVVKS